MIFKPKNKVKSLTILTANNSRNSTFQRKKKNIGFNFSTFFLFFYFSLLTFFETKIFSIFLTLFYLGNIVNKVFVRNFKLQRETIDVNTLIILLSKKASLVSTRNEFRKLNKICC